MTQQSRPAIKLQMTQRMASQKNWLLWGMSAVLGLAATQANATNFPITPNQRSTAQQVAAAGIPLSELAPNAPDSHVVKRGDTLWDISKLFL